MVGGGGSTDIHQRGAYIWHDTWSDARYMVDMISVRRSSGRYCNPVFIVRNE